MRKFLTIFFVLNLFVLSGQEKIDTTYMSKFSEAKQLIDDSLFFKANEVFMNDLLKEGYVLPDEVCFQFGKSLFYSGYKKQGKVFLYKYLELIQSDTSDVFFKPTIEILKLLGEDVTRYEKRKEVVSTSDSTATTGEKKLSHSKTADCNSDEVFICPVCNGTTVLVRKGSFGNTYQTCPYCNEDGIMDCHSYQLYLKGELFSK